MQKSIGQQFVESGAATKAHKGASGREVTIRGDIKTLMTTATGWVPDSLREPGAVRFANRTPGPGLLDLVLTTPTNNSVVKYMEETGYTSNAAETSEGSIYGEAALSYTERSADVAKLTVWLPVTDEELDDVDGLGSWLDQRLGFMLRQRLEAQILTGNGTSPNLRGILNTAGIQTQAKGADSLAVAIRKAKTKVKTPGHGDADLIVFNPADSEDVDVAAATDASVMFADTSRLWNVPRTEVDALTAGTAVIGDWSNYTALRVKKAITLQVSNSHSTFFVEGKQAIRAEIRAAFPVYRPAAFVTITGI